MNRKLKGVKRLERVVNKFLKQFGLKSAFAVEFYYLPERKKVAFSFLKPPNDDWFMEFFNSLAPDIECDSFLASLMHEIGHHMTYNDFDDEDWEQDYLNRNMLEAKGTAISNKDINFEYFNLPTERAATEWAIEYIHANVEQLRVFWANMRRTIEWFYNINYVEVEEVGC